MPGRRAFLRGVLACGARASILGCVLSLPLVSACARGDEAVTTPDPGTRRTPTPPPGTHEARYYRRLERGLVQCEMCWRGCEVAPDDLGECGTRKNVGGRYYSLVYARPAALQIDPIEKEPAFHVLPGSQIFCTGTAGCNNRCKFCHNWHLSQSTPHSIQSYDYSPDDIVAAAQAAGCQAVSFTYNEPTVFYELMYDVAARARRQGLRAICHTNGGMAREPLLALLELMDAVTVDLKAFTEEFYLKVSSSKLAPVLSTLETIRRAGKHLEIVNLVIPALNDDLGDVRRMCAWIKAHLGPDVPLHFTRFFPAYKLQHSPPTPIPTLEAAAGIADAEGLQYVYIGNTPGHRRNSTFCPRCGTTLISRVHFHVLAMALDKGQCAQCGQAIPGVWASAPDAKPPRPIG